MKYILLLTTFFALASCTKTIEYKYTDKEQVLNCTMSDSQLMHEALYSFQDDIGAASPNNNYEPGTPFYYKYAYAAYIYHGVNGSADYKNIATPHAMDLAKALQDEPNLWLGKAPNVQLNYKSDFVLCLIENIDNEIVRQPIQTLSEIGPVDIKLLTDIFMKNIKDSDTDKDMAMYIALETYYRHLINGNFTNKSENE